MHPRMAELFAHLDQGRAVLDDAIASVPTDLRSAKPGPDRWSVAEVVEHVVIIEQRIGAMIGSQIADAKAKGLPRDGNPSSILATYDARRAVDRTTRFVNPSANPTGTLDVASSLVALDAARRDLKAAAMTGDGLDLTQVTSPHRAFGPMTMYDWIAFAGSHVERHADQIREIGAALSERRSS